MNRWMLPDSLVGTKKDRKKESALHGCPAITAMVLAALLFPILLHPPSSVAADKATPQEVYDKVVEAAGFLSRTGSDGLKEFEKPNGKFVWKDSYVWVTECDGIYCSIGPESQLSGLGISKVKCYKTGKFYILILCDRIKDNPHGSWVEYWRPRPGAEKPERRISFMMQVPGKPCQVVAGSDGTCHRQPST